MTSQGEAGKDGVDGVPGVNGAKVTSDFEQQIFYVAVTYIPVILSMQRCGHTRPRKVASTKLMTHTN